MARLEQESLTKTSSKFDSFLKRTLPESSLERIRGYEACIVCSEKENKSFKYVVLSDESLYLTENPPKSIQETIPLQHVFNIQMMEDYPDFLSGEERLNTMHIRIKYTVTSTKKAAGGSANGSRLSKSRSETSIGGSTPDGSPRRNDSDPALSLTGDWRTDDSRPGSSLSAGPHIEDGDSPRSIVSAQKGGRSKAKRGKFGLRKKVTIKEGERVLPVGEGSMEDVGLFDRNSPIDGGLLHNRSHSADGPYLDGLISELGGGQETRRKVVLNLYMLKANSNMFVLLKSAADNHIIRSTLMLDPDYSQRLQSSAGRATQQVEKVEQLFLQLSKELLEPTNTMEQMFQLLHELMSATEKNFSLKRLFWKNPDLFPCCVRQLQLYLPKSPIPSSSVESGRARRADEFELIVLLAEVLGLMFRETEIFPSRLRVLRGDSGRVTYDLIMALTCFPELPQRYRPPTEKASKLLMTTQMDQWNTKTDSELHELYQAFSHAASSVLYELILIAQQSNWGVRTGSFFSVTWIVNILEELNTTEKFLERVVSQAMTFVQPSKRLQLTPRQALLVLQEFTILHTVMTYSPSLAMFIRNNYTEEFKYYIQGAVLHEKLPATYPTSATTVNLIGEVMSTVLLRKCSLSLDSSF